MEITQELAEKTLQISKEIQTIVLKTKDKQPGKDFEDYVFLALYTKLAELELRLDIQDKQIHELLNLIA